MKSTIFGYIKQNLLLHTRVREIGYFVLSCTGTVCIKNILDFILSCTVQDSAVSARRTVQDNSIFQYILVQLDSYLICKFKAKNFCVKNKKYCKNQFTCNLAKRPVYTEIYCCPVLGTLMNSCCPVLDIMILSMYIHSTGEDRIF